MTRILKNGTDEIDRADLAAAADSRRCRPGGRGSCGAGSGSRHASGGTFAATMRSPRAQRTDRSLAMLADDVYYPSRSGHRIDGFIRLDSAELEKMGIPPSAINDARSGLTSAVYRDDRGRHVLAFAGTDRTSLRSWHTNFSQGIGLPARQYVLAGRLGKLARVAFGDELVITGHSLGGGLATAAALKSGAPAVVFNGAGLAEQTIRGLGLEPAAAREYAAAGNIRSYVVAGDPLTVFQETSRVHRSVIGGIAGGLAGSSIGGALGSAIGGHSARIAGTVAGRTVGGAVGAVIGGAAGATSTASGLAQVQRVLGARIDLPDPLPDGYSGGRLARAIELHEMSGVRKALDSARPWSGPSGG